MVSPSFAMLPATALSPSEPAVLGVTGSHRHSREAADILPQYKSEVVKLELEQPIISSADFMTINQQLHLNHADPSGETTAAAAESGWLSADSSWSGYWQSQPSRGSNNPLDVSMTAITAARNKTPVLLGQDGKFSLLLSRPGLRLLLF